MTKTIELDGLDGLQGVFDDIGKDFEEVRYVELLQGELDILQRAHTDYYVSQSSPVGEAWPVLSPVTIRKKGHAVILFETGQQMQSLTSADAEDAIRDIQEIHLFTGLTFGTSAPFAAFHQAGTRRMPARPHVGMNEPQVDFLAESVADETVKQLLDKA